MTIKYATAHGNGEKSRGRDSPEEEPSVQLVAGRNWACYFMSQVTSQLLGYMIKAEYTHNKKHFMFVFFFKAPDEISLN